MKGERFPGDVTTMSSAPRFTCSNISISLPSTPSGYTSTLTRPLVRSFTLSAKYRAPLVKG